MPDTPITAETPWAISPIGPDRHLEAVRSLLPHAGRDSHTAARRFLEYSHQHHVPLDAMWSLVDASGVIRATVLGVPSPGGTAMLFATTPRSPGEQQAIAGLIEHACRGLRELGVELAQVLMDPGDTAAMACFADAQFFTLANLSYMERSIRAADARLQAPLPADYAIEPFPTGARAEMVDLLERTYIATLDCPGLVGLRKADDILTGHEAVGDRAAHDWLVLREHGRAVGTLMLNPSSSGGTVELVYLGLAPEARGKGLARLLLRTGISNMSKRRERTITLAVDQLNVPAVSLYSREGFRPMLDRVAMIRSLRNLSTTA